MVRCFITLGHHKGALWDLDPSWDSQYLLTACADGQARLFNATTGDLIVKMPHRGCVPVICMTEFNKLPED